MTEEDKKLSRPVRPVVKVEKPKPRPAAPKVGAQPAPVAPKVIAEHTVTNDDTLSGIALKYYGSAVKKWYMYIYETNKDVIGDNPNVIRPGIVLKILEKPDL